MLDQLPTSSPLQLASWLGCLFFLVAGWNQVERFFDRRAHRASKREIQPQPLSVAKFDSPVPETLCRSRRKEMSGEITRLEHELACLRQERHAEAGEWRQKISEINREVGELRASIELNSQHLMRIDSKLDRVIERHHS
jgi:chromosome segregation ATPase